MRKPSLMLLLAALLGFGLSSFVALARPPTVQQVNTLLNGEPAAFGVLTSAAGASITNATTAAPFTFSNVGARVIAIQCDATAFVGFGATCGTTLAASGGCYRIDSTSAPTKVVLQDTTTTMNAAGPAAFNCIVSKLN